MQRNRWSKNFDWVKSGNTYYQQNRLEKYNENRFIAVGDIYFKLNKYLTGVTFSYINSLNDIYKRDLLTGDGYSIVNMYNEYDVIDRVMKNIVFVDVASDVNINLNLQWSKIDGVQLKPGHLVLLYGQDSEFQNDIYKVSNQYFLQNAGLLSTREKSNRFTCSVKLGTQRDKQFFLVNNGFDFPTMYEPKYFIEGRSYLLKNLIKYNIYNTATSSAATSKIIFTDYDFARKQLIENYNLFGECTLDISGVSSTDYFFNITYHHDEYKIRTGTTNVMVGPIPAITNATYALGSIIPINYDGNLYTIDGGIALATGGVISFDIDGFDSGATLPAYFNYIYSGISFKVGDHLQIRFINTLDSGTTETQFLYMKTFVKEVRTPDTSTIDGGDANSFFIDGGASSGSTGITMDSGGASSGSTETIDGGGVTSEGDYDGGDAYTSSFIGTIDGGSASFTDFSNYIVIEEAIPNNILKDLKNYYYEITNLNVARNWTEAVDFLEETKFIDFYEIETLSISGDTVGEGSVTFYPKESKYDRYFDYNGIYFYRADGIETDFYTPVQYIKYTLYDRLSNINSSVFTSSFSIFNSYSLFVTSYQYIDNGRIRLITNLSGMTDIFKPYTYVNATSTEGTIRALVYSVKEFEIIIEKPLAWSIYPVQSQLPAMILIQNIDGLETISNILYEVYMNVTYDWYIQKSDNERKYICRAYAELLTENEDFRKYVTGILYENEKNEFILKLYEIENDPQLRYSPIELSFIGADRKTRLPVPLQKEKKTATSSAFILDSEWSVIYGGDDTDYTGEEFEVLDLGFDSVIGGVNNPPVTFTLIDGNG